MHPLFQLIATRPQLLADHAEAYAALVAVEVPRISAAWQRSAVFNALALCALIAGLVLAGVALMLWATLPDAPMRAAWVLLAVPLLALSAALACAMAARSGDAGVAMNNLRLQIAADIALLRAAAAA